MLQCAVSCHLPSRDGAGCHLSRGVQCYGVGIRCYARWGRMFFPLGSDPTGGTAGRREKYLKLVIAGAAGVPDLCNASQGWSKQPHRTDY